MAFIWNDLVNICFDWVTKEISSARPHKVHVTHFQVLVTQNQPAHYVQHKPNPTECQAELLHEKRRFFWSQSKCSSLFSSELQNPCEFDDTQSTSGQSTNTNSIRKIERFQNV